MSLVKEADLKINFQTYGGRELHTLNEHTHTHKHHNTSKVNFFSGIPVWRGTTVDDLIVVGMNGLPETEKSIRVKISQTSSGMRTKRPNAERVFMVDFLPLPA